MSLPSSLVAALVLLASCSPARMSVSPSSASRAPLPTVSASHTPGTATLKSDRDDTYLEAKTPSGWRTVCAAPCEAELWQGHRYRLRMRGKIAGSEFSVARGDSVAIDARTGNPTGRGAGIAMTAVGIVVMGAGIAMGLDEICVFCEEREQSSDDDIVFISGLGISAIGLLIAYANQGEITVSDPGSGAQPMTRLKVGKGLELSAQGLHF